MSKARKHVEQHVRPGGRRVPVLSPCLRHETGEGEIVVYVLQTQELLMFNDIGAGVFVLLDGERTIDEIAAFVASCFEEDLERVRDDVETFLEALRERHVVSYLEQTLGPRPSAAG